MIIGASITACILSYNNGMNYVYLKNGLVFCCSLSWVQSVILASTRKTVVCAFGGMYDFLSRAQFYSKFEVLAAMVLNVSTFGMFWSVDVSKHPRKFDWINILFIKSLDCVGVVNKVVVDISFTFDVIKCQLHTQADTPHIRFTNHSFQAAFLKLDSERWKCVMAEESYWQS